MKSRVFHLCAAFAIALPAAEPLKASSIAPLFEAVVVGVSRDDAASHKAFQAKHTLNFLLLVNTDDKLTAAFNAATPDGTKSRRVSFLIGKDGKIIHITDNRDTQVHLDELKQSLAATKP